MTKSKLNSAVFITIALHSLLVGCASQIPQVELGKQDVTKKSEVQTGNSMPLIESSIGSTAGPGSVAEELPALAEESTVFFLLGSATLGYKEKQKLELIAERLAADRSLHVSLLGYANDNGSSSFNLAVSDNRVTVVAAFLRKCGVQGGQIRTQALGSEKVASSCRSANCRQSFRRVDLLVSKAK